MGTGNTNAFHLIGAGGIGMSALGQILLQMGASVSGSDLHDSGRLKHLKQMGAQIQVGHDPALITSQACVVYSSDIGEDNPELIRSRELGCRLLHRSDLLRELMTPYRSLLVTGTHGKTTVTSLLVWLLLKTGRQPAFAMGGVMRGVEYHGQYGLGEYFVAEADESDGSFLKYNPFGAIVTNVEWEHLEYYHSLEAMQACFLQFIGNVSSLAHLIWCGDDPWLTQAGLQGLSYGLSPTCQLRATQVRPKGFRTSFIVELEGDQVAQIDLPLVGDHNVVNALAVIGMGSRLGIEWTEIEQAMVSFPGVHQRLEHKGEVGGVMIYDDYAHHPTEVRVTLAGMRRALGSRRIVVVIQPHRYQRWKGLLDEFCRAFTDADRLFITDVYGKRESPLLGIDGPSLAHRLGAIYLPRLSLVDHLLPYLKRQDGVIFMGAGDLSTAAAELSECLRLYPLPPLEIGVIFGGASPEHDVSVKSAEWFVEHLASPDYRVDQFIITRQGKWRVGEGSSDLIDLPPIDRLKQCDVVIPVLHGDRGEDGLIAALMENLGVPCVGCDFRSAAVFMDKVLTKHIARSLEIPTAPFIDLWRHQWESASGLYLQRIEALGYPLFVKPAHLGSTFGVSRVVDLQELMAALDRAFVLDHRLVVEREIVGREIEFCALQTRDKFIIGHPAEVLKTETVHSYDSKYGPSASPFDLRPAISEHVLEQGRQFAHEMLLAVGGRDLARVDFFLDADNRWWLNEVNPFPGCTPTSAFPLVWKAAGDSPAETIRHLVLQALSRGQK